MEARRGTSDDLDAVAAIQAASPQASHWPVNEYLQYEFTIAITNRVIAGFLVWRRVVEDEVEVLNVAVGAEWRRRGIARMLVDPLLKLRDTRVFLEVRESNQTARMFYKSMGFQEVSIRKEYYREPPESAIVMKFHSC